MAPMKKTTRHRENPFAGTLSLDEAAHQLGMPTRELRRILGRGEAPFLQVRGRIRVPQHAVAKLKQQLEGAA